MQWLHVSVWIQRQYCTAFQLNQFVGLLNAGPRLKLTQEHAVYSSAPHASKETAAAESAMNSECELNFYNRHRRCICLISTVLRWTLYSCKYGFMGNSTCDGYSVCHWMRLLKKELRNAIVQSWNADLEAKKKLDRRRNHWNWFWLTSKLLMKRFEVRPTWVWVYWFSLSRTKCLPNCSFTLCSSSTLSTPTGIRKTLSSIMVIFWTESLS